MTGFLTVEDVNSVLHEYGDVNEMYMLDTSLLGDISYATYDFVKVTKTDNAFVFEVDNSLWCGGYFFTDSNDDYLDVDATYDSEENTLTLATNDDVHLYLYLCGFAPEFEVNRLTWCPLISENPLHNFVSFHDPSMQNYAHVTGKFKTGTFYDASSMGEDIITNAVVTETLGTFSEEGTITIDVGYYGRPNRQVQYVECNGSKFYFLIRREEFVPTISFNGSENIIAKLNAKTSITYTATMDNETVNLGFVRIKYLNKVIELPAGTDTFEIDLTEIRTAQIIPAVFELAQTGHVRAHSYPVNIICTVPTVTTISDFCNLINAGEKVINVGANLSYQGVITIATDILINGNDHEINCYFDVKEGVTFKLKDCIVKNNNYSGLAIITQKEKSIVEIDNVTFEGNKSIGNAAILETKNSVEGLNKSSDFITKIKNTVFKNNDSCILHGGNLQIDNCVFRAGYDEDYYITKQVAFIYQTDGILNVTNSIFDIDTFNETYFCQNEISLNLGITAIRLGTDVIFNGLNYNSILEGNFELKNNTSHIYAEYSYNDECIVISPIVSKEANCMCYLLENKGIRQYNVQITDKSDDLENTTRKIVWED